MEQRKSKYYGRRLKKPDLKTVGGFTQIPNAFLLNPEIGDAELRLLIYLLAQTNNYKIKSEDCFKYLGKTKQAVNPQFKKLVKLGILKITEDIIEIIVPEEMKKYKIGYLKGIEINPDVVKKTLLNGADKKHQVGQENFTNRVKKTLPSDKENFTSEVNNSLNKPLGYTDNVDATDDIIKYNTNRVLPVPATSGSTGQSHSNDNTKDNTGSKLDLECDSLQSQASPSVLAPSLHTPKKVVEDGHDESRKSLSNSTSKSHPNEENNDLETVLNNVPYFKVMYENANWNKINISSFSNTDISKFIIEREKNNENEQISSRAYFFMEKLITYSSIMGDDSKLWTEFQRQCKAEKKSKLISKYLHKSMRTQV